MVIPPPVAAGKALSSSQELRLITYLDEQLLILSRHFETRHSSRAALPTLPLYLSAILRLHSVILPIPPIKPSSALRVAYLLNLTSLLPEAFAAFEINEDALNTLWGTLRTFDQSWMTVLQGQVWDPELLRGRKGSLMDQGGVAPRDTEVRGTDLVRLDSIITETIAVLGEVLGTMKKREGVDLGGEVVEPAFEPDSKTDLDQEDTSSAVMDDIEDTPSLVTDVSMDDIEDNMEVGGSGDEDDDDDEDDFEEVNVDNPSEDFSIRVSAPAPRLIQIPLARDIRPGFDPDEEYGAEEEEEEEEASDESIAIEVGRVFQESRDLIKVFQNS